MFANVLRLFFLLFLFSSGTSLSALSLKIEEIKKHIDERFSQAKIELYPFPHLTIEHIFPEEFYLEMLNHWPKNEFNKNKKQSIVTLDLLEKNRDTQIIWTEFASSIVDQIIKRKIAEIFKEYSFLRFDRLIQGDYLCDAKNLADHRLVEERGPGISPHIDQGYIFAAMAIYFPDPTDYNHTDFGTYFYIHKNSRTSVDVCFDKNVIPITSAPYKPNTLSVWLQTSHSWHSGPLHFLDRDYIRRFYLTLIYLSPDFMKVNYGHLFKLDENFLDEDHLY